MKFRIPFTIGTKDKLKKRADKIIELVSYKKDAPMSLHLADADAGFSREEYLGIIYYLLGRNVLVLSMLTTLALLYFSIGFFYLWGPLAGVVFSGFMFFVQVNYPKIYVEKKQRGIDRNLIPALEDMVVQLNAGIPLYSILLNISASDYGELSEEFKKAVRKINAGLPQVEVLEKIGERNSSLHFRRTLWQISNGMRAGSDISIIIKEGIRSLNEEQLIQIQNYGNKLNPMIMFYMLSSVIIPALSITFLTVISSLVNLDKAITTALFVGLFVGVVIIQVIFIGAIRSIRPSLL